MSATQIHSTVDFARTGKQQGHLCVPYSYNLAGWANLLLPISVISNGAGPTALVMAGNHGDEYPGQVAILRLMRELDRSPELVRGRVILIPALNMPAAKAGTRLSPLDGKNLNRSFPGKADGTPTEMIADYLTRVLFPLADIVIDIHTGGRGVDFYPCATCTWSKTASSGGGWSRALWPGIPTSRFSMPTSPARACCRSKPNGRAKP